jgi:hypothetical protein
MLIGLIKQGFMLHSYDLFLALNLVSLQPNGAFMWVYLFADFLKGLYEQSNLSMSNIAMFYFNVWMNGKLDLLL